jgi:hypothetical protein
MVDATLRMVCKACESACHALAIRIYRDGNRSLSPTTTISRATAPDGRKAGRPRLERKEVQDQTARNFRQCSLFRIWR